MSRKIVADCRNGAIVRTRDGRWGVVCLGPSTASRRHGYRVIDYWDGGREYVRNATVVEIA